VPLTDSWSEPVAERPVTLALTEYWRFAPGGTCSCPKEAPTRFPPDRLQLWVPALVMTPCSPRDRVCFELDDDGVYA